jgi:hypothetical protein
MRLRTPWLWIPLLVAFAPTLAALVSDLRLAPRHAFVAFVAVGVAALCARERAQPASPGRASGLALLVLGLVLELLGAASETQLVARFGLPIAALGLARWLGAPRALPLALGFWCIPLPNALIQLTSPTLEATWASLAAAVCAGLGADLRAAGITLLAGEARLDLRSENGGLPAAHALAAFGWFRAVWCGRRATGAALRALQGYALGFALQPIAVTLAALLLALGERELARAWLTHLQWLFAALGWWLWERRRRAAAARPPSHSGAASRQPMTPA